MPSVHAFDFPVADMHHTQAPSFSHCCAFFITLPQSANMQQISRAPSLVQFCSHMRPPQRLPASSLHRRQRFMPRSCRLCRLAFAAFQRTSLYTESLGVEAGKIGSARSGACAARVVRPCAKRALFWKRAEQPATLHAVVFCWPEQPVRQDLVVRACLCMCMCTASRHWWCQMHCTRHGILREGTQPALPRPTISQCCRTAHVGQASFHVPAGRHSQQAQAGLAPARSAPVSLPKVAFIAFDRSIGSEFQYTNLRKSCGSLPWSCSNWRAAASRSCPPPRPALLLVRAPNSLARI